MENSDHNDQRLLTELSAEIVSAYVSNNPCAADGLPSLISDVFDALTGLSGPQEPVLEKLEPAVSIRKSQGHDHLVCLEDGKSFKSLKRHLKAHHNLSPEEYRKRWGLPHDYPMVAPAYAQTRSKLAKSIGLGRKPKGKK